MNYQTYNTDLGWVISQDETWMPGVFETEQEAIESIKDNLMTEDENNIEDMISAMDELKSIVIGVTAILVAGTIAAALCFIC